MIGHADRRGRGDPRTSGTVFDGTLDRGVKESFRTYVTGPVASGGVALADGATGNADGSYRLPGGEGTLDLSFSELTVAVTGAFGGAAGGAPAETGGEPPSCRRPSAPPP